MTTTFDLAEALHNKFCRLSHIDQCEWEYEVGRAYLWHEPAHKQYLDRAGALSRATNLATETLIKVIENL